MSSGALPIMAGPLLNAEDVLYYRSFIDNVEDFADDKCQEIKLSNLPGVRGWLLPLVDGSSLHLYEETTDEEHAACDQCRIMGESSRHASIYPASQRCLGFALEFKACVFPQAGTTTP